jgi:predicted nucleic acid-binding protein
VAREAVLVDFVGSVEFVEIREAVVACRNPEDDQYLALAMNGGADCIVT